MLEKTNPSMVRQIWLLESENALRARFHSLHYKVPPKVRVSVGFPKGTKGGHKGTVIGQCHSATASRDEHDEIFISPIIGHDGKPDKTSSYLALATLAHELCHSVCGNKVGHRIVRKPSEGEKRYDKKHEKWRMSFPTVADAIGLEGKWTATVPGPEFIRWAEPLLDRIGLYPPGALASYERKKDTNRQLKCECDTCGYVVRTTKKWIKAAGAPICPTDNAVMSCDAVDEDDEDGDE